MLDIQLFEFKNTLMEKMKPITFYILVTKGKNVMSFLVTRASLFSSYEFLPGSTKNIKMRR